MQSLDREFDLATVFNLPKGESFNVTADYIQQQVIRYNEVDDLYQNAFLANVVFQGPKEDCITVTTEAWDYLHGLGTKCVIGAESDSLPPGPYAVVGNQLRDAWKLVDDSNGTCMVTLKPQSK